MERLDPKKELLFTLHNYRGDMRGMQSRLDRLQPAAEAYEVIKQILGLMPRGGLVGESSTDWRLSVRIEELEAELKAVDKETKTQAQAAKEAAQAAVNSAFRNTTASELEQAYRDNGYEPCMVADKHDAGEPVPTESNEPSEAYKRYANARGIDLNESEGTVAGGEPGVAFVSSRVGGALT